MSKKKKKIELYTYTNKMKNVYQDLDSILKFEVKEFRIY